MGPILPIFTKTLLLCVHSTSQHCLFFPQQGQFSIHFGNLVIFDSFPQQGQSAHINPVHILLLSCATPCILSHQILSHSMDNQTDITPVLILFISTKSLVYNVPFQAFHHIRFFPTARTYIIYIYILSISTKSLFIMCPFRCFVLIDCFPHQGH